MKSKLYSTTIVHKRFYPFNHEFKYLVPSLFISYDELDELKNNLKFFSVNRFNIFSFYDKDHGYRNGESLEKYVLDYFKKKNIVCYSLKIKILCFPRIFGYTFNPLSIIFCYEKDDIIGIFYEVKNTSNEQHTYFFGDKKPIKKKNLTHQCDKNFYVSPFIGMKSLYKFTIQIPDITMSVIIKLYDKKQKKILMASQFGKMKNLNSLSLIKELLLNPLLTFKVISAILFESIRIIYKGGKYYSRKKKLTDSITFEGKL